VEELMLAIQVSPSTPHQYAMNTIRLFGKYVIPPFKRRRKEARLPFSTSAPAYSI
jgi:hypothetical protein